MAEPIEEEQPGSRSSGDRRGNDRRRDDRRRDERRAPPPFWRRPAAFVAYGVVGALALVLLFGGDDDEEARETAAEMERVALNEDVPAPPRDDPGAASRDVYTVAEFEGLIAEGQSAVGMVVRTELYCGSITPVATRESTNPEPLLEPFKDSEGRVPGAECRWSRDARSSDILLIVPPELAEEFAMAPEIELNFVSRRVIPADVQWLGRSESLALRLVGILVSIR